MYLCHQDGAGKAGWEERQEPKANAYVLMHSTDFPTLRIGKRMVVPKDKLIEWIETQINK